ncbi:MAG TPA: hypothetical protein PKO11_09590, partial [Bacteroidales bacterium]|nr:hypothetical protein [Bacteroidales bacterium]
MLLPPTSGRLNGKTYPPGALLPGFRTWWAQDIQNHNPGFKAAAANYTSENSPTTQVKSCQ